MHRVGILGLALVFAAGAVTGCADGRPAKSGFDLTIAGEIRPNTGEPRLVKASFNEAPAMAHELAQDGYVVVGTSKYLGSEQPLDEIVAHAKKLGAAVILKAVEFHQTAQSRPAPTGNGQPIDMPYDVEQFDQRVFYFSQMTREGPGFSIREPNANDLKRLSSDHVVVVSIVRNDSPAFEAGILEGDGITAINGQAVLEAHSSVDLMRALRGTDMSLAILRNGKALTRVVTFPAGPW